MVNHPNRSKLYSDHTGTTYTIISREDLPNGDAILNLTRGTKLRHLIERAPKDSPSDKFRVKRYRDGNYGPVYAVTE